MLEQQVKLYKIFYDSRSLNDIKDPFIPLDNTSGPSGWFELFPILKFLENNILDEDTWYGFFSPKFPEKSGFMLSEILSFIKKNAVADVALISTRPMHILWHDNVWVQGEKYHPGLIKCTEEFLRKQGENPNLRLEIGDFENSVFSNYIIAKKRFWDDWAELSRAYFDYVEESNNSLLDSAPTSHVGPSDYYLKTFVQERLASWLMIKNSYLVVHPNYFIHNLTELPDNTKGKAVIKLIKITYRLKKSARKNSWKGAKNAFKIMRKISAFAYENTEKYTRNYDL